MTVRSRVTSRTAAVFALLALAAGVLAAPASAAPTLTTGTTGYSAAASTGTGSMSAQLTLSGSLGRLIDYIVGPIVSQDLNPLLAALSGSANSLVSAALGSASSMQAATTPSQTQYTVAPAAFPNDTLPAPCVSSGPQPCYSAASGSVSAAPLASVSLGAINGYTEQVANSADATNPTFGRATVASTSVSVLPGIAALGNPVVSAGLINSKSNCPNDGPGNATKPTTAPSVNETATNVSVLGGLVKFGVLDGQITNLIVNGTSYASVLSLPTITVGATTVDNIGTSVIVSVALTPAQILGAIGLSPTVVTALTGFAPTSSITLSLVLGPNSTLTNRTASAWGLGIGVDLSGSLSFNLLDLVTATVTVPTGIGGSNVGNLLDLRLAYTSCVSGTNAVISSIVPAALV